MIETIVSAVIILVMMGAVMAVCYSGRISFDTTQVKVGLYQKIRTALRSMEQELIQSSVSLLDISPNGGFYDSLTLKIPQGIDDDGNITWSDDITYACNGTVLERTQGGVVTPLASDVTYLGFRIDPSTPSVVEIYVSAEKGTAFTRQLNVDLQVAVKVRN